MQTSSEQACRFLAGAVLIAVAAPVALSLAATVSITGTHSLPPGTILKRIVIRDGVQTAPQIVGVVGGPTNPHPALSLDKEEGNELPHTDLGKRERNELPDPALPLEKGEGNLEFHPDLALEKGEGKDTAGEGDLHTALAPEQGQGSAEAEAESVGEVIAGAVLDDPQRAIGWPDAQDDDWGAGLLHNVGPFEERVVYRNTLGIHSIAAGAGNLIADDVLITAGDPGDAASGRTGCKLTRFEFVVDGRVAGPFNTGPFRVDYAFYSTSPYAVPAPSLPGRVIPGTSGVAEFPDEGPYLVSVVLSEQADVPIHPTMWFGLKFSRNNAGPMIGAPATQGYTQDLYHCPTLPCPGSEGAFPDRPYLGFYLQIWARDCLPARPAYHSYEPKGLILNPGANRWLIDDVQLLGGACNMVGYEVGVRGSGLYTFEFRHACDGSAIQDTRQMQNVTSENAATQSLRFSISPPVPLLENTWFAAKVNNNTGGVIVAGVPPDIGNSQDTLAVLDHLAHCTSDDRRAVHDALQLTVFCEGPAPTGACCDPFLKECRGPWSGGRRCDDDDDCDGDDICEPLCRNLTEYNCWFPPKNEPAFELKWVARTSCGDNQFEAPCGQFACCKPDYDDACENLTQHQCDGLLPLDRPRQWQLGRYCGHLGQACPFHACTDGAGDCNRTQSTQGCDIFDCCIPTCEADRWCCSVEWDMVCLRQVESCAAPGNYTCVNAAMLSPGQSAEVSNVEADETLPLFSCPIGTPVTHPGAIWFKFIASDGPVRIHTCHTGPPSQDTLLSVYEPADPTSSQSACGSLIEIACSNDATHCGNGAGSDVCLGDLTPGHVYYIQVASATVSDLGILRVDLESACPPGSSVLPSRDGEIVLLPRGADTLASAPQNPRQRKQESPAHSGDIELEMLRFAQHDSASASGVGSEPKRQGHYEKQHDPYLPPRPRFAARAPVRRGPWTRDGFVSIQVNVDFDGQNIPGDAANEPSIAIDPGSPNRMVIGWRQFDTVESNFRQAGWAYSHDSGKTWTFPGVIEPQVFRSDPVLAVDGLGFFHYYSLTANFEHCDLFTSFDGGMTWKRKINGYGGDKAWMIVEPEANDGIGHLYAAWSDYYSCCGRRNFVRSTDGIESLEYPTEVVVPRWGTLAVGPERELYVAGGAFSIFKSLNAFIPYAQPVFSPMAEFYLGPATSFGGGPNPGGLLGQTWIAVDRSEGAYRSNVYALATAKMDSSEQTDVLFTRSEDGGLSWTPPTAVHPQTFGWQWFGTMSVSPRGRIDVFWNDAAPTGEMNLSELRYAYSVDAGRSWSEPVAVSPVFDSFIGWPKQDKIGDYYHSISDNAGVSLAYSATFNGEQDIYFLRVGADLDCNGTGSDDYDDVVAKLSGDCNGNLFPDECERDFDGDGVIDDCDDDLDGDGVPNADDRCGHTPLGISAGRFGAPAWDTNENCESDLSDYWRFLNCMLGGRPGLPAPAAACRAAFDRDADGTTDLRDFAAFQAEYGRSMP